MGLGGQRRPVGLSEGFLWGIGRFYHVVSVQIIFKPILAVLYWIGRFFTIIFDYFDSTYRFREDWHVVPYFFYAIFKYGLRIGRNRFQNWYIFESQVKRYGKRPCLIYARPLEAKGEFQIERYTYKETYDIVLRLTHILHCDYGIGSGDYIGIYYTNKQMYVFLWLALWNIGAIPAFLNYNQVGKPLVHSVTISNLNKILVDPQVKGTMEKSESILHNAVPNLEIHYLEEAAIMERIQAPGAPKLRLQDKIRTPKSVNDFDPAMLIYTSGTTGLPKSAIMSWRKATVGCELFGRVMHISSKSVILTAMPLYHSTAALLGVCAVFSQGGCVAISNRFSASSFWKEAYLTGTTHIQYVGEVCRYLLNSPKSEYEDMCDVKIAYGNGLRSGIWMDFKNRFHIDIIGEFYASTEAPFATTSFQKGDFGVGSCRNYGTLVSWILSYQQTLVKMDPNDESSVYRNRQGFCEVPPPGEPGELLMRIFKPRKPETSFQGYLGNKKATESKVLRDVFRKGDAWYRSGDLLKSDENKLWYFVDRLGDTFRWKSENVSTSEVENAILQFSDNIFDVVMVVGLKVPKYEGRAGFAIIQLKSKGYYSPLNNGTPSSGHTPKREKVLNGESSLLELLKNLLSHLTDHLPKYAIPVFVKFIDKIETTNTHKLPKALYKNQQLPRGNDGETIYWLKDYKSYKALTDNDWRLITDGVYRL